MTKRNETNPSAVRAMPAPKRIQALRRLVDGTMAERKTAALAVNPEPAQQDAPGNKAQSPILTK